MGLELRCLPDTVAPVEAAPKAIPPANGASGPQHPVKPAPSAGEAAPPVASPAASPDSKDDRFAKLAAKESAIVAKELEIKAERERLAADRAEVERLKALKAGAKLRPLHAVKEALGLSFEELQQAALNNGAATPEVVVATVQEKLDEFEAKQAAKAKAEQDAQAARHQANHARALSQWKKDVVDTVKADASYELISVFGAQDAVHQKIESHFEATCEKDDAGNITRPGVLLSTKEAADIVESEFVERVKKAQASKKFQPQPVAKATPPPGSPVDGKRSDVVQPRTISNDMTVSTPAAFPSAHSEDEAFSRALAILNGAKK